MASGTVKWFNATKGYGFIPSRTAVAARTSSSISRRSRRSAWMAAASNKTTQSFVLALSGWIGTRVPCDFLLKMLMNKAYGD